MEDLRLLGPTTSSVPARASMLQIRFLHRKSRPTSEQGLVTLMQLRHGYKAMQRSVLSLVHHTHPPTAQLLDDPVMRDGLADHGGPGTQGCHVRSAAEAKSTHEEGECMATEKGTPVTSDYVLRS